MKREMDLVRKLLLAIEKNPRQISVEGFEPELVKYQAALLIEAGLVLGSVSNAASNTSVAPVSVFIERLTWDGHEFVDTMRQEAVWNTIKKNFKDASLSTVFSVGKQLAEGYAKKKVSEVLDEQS